MNLKDYLISVFGYSESAKKFIDPFMKTLDGGINKAGMFKMMFGEQVFLEKIKARTGLKIGEIRKIFRNSTIIDERFNGAYLPDSNIQMTLSQAMQAILMYEQADQREKASMTWNIEQIMNALTENEHAIIGVLQEVYESMSNVIRDEVKDKLGIEMKKVDNYAPIRMAQPISTSIGKSIRPYIVPSFVMEQDIGEKEFDPTAGALEIFESHVAEAAIFMGMQDSAVFARNTFLNDDVLMAVENKYGKRVADDLKEFIITAVTQKTASNATLTSKDWMAKAALSLQMLPLFYNIQSAFRQMSSIPAFALENDISHGDALKAITYSITNPNSEAWNRIKESGTLKERYLNTAMLELGQIEFEGEKGTADQALLFMQKIFNMGLKPNQAMDLFTIRLVAPGILQNRVDKLNAQGAFEGDQEKVWDEALTRTLGIINATQQSTQIHNRSLAHLRYPTLRVFLAPFTSTVQQYASKEFSAFNAWRNAEDPTERSRAAKQFGKVFVLNHVVLPIAFNLLGYIFQAYGLGNKPDDDEKKNRLFVQLVSSMLVGSYSGVFFSGSLFKGAIESITYRAAGVKTPYYSQGPFAPMLNQLADFNKKFKEIEDFMTVVKETQWSDPEDVFEVFMEPFKTLPPVRDVKKAIENRK